MNLEERIALWLNSDPHDRDAIEGADLLNDAAEELAGMRADNRKLLAEAGVLKKKLMAIQIDNAEVGQLAVDAIADRDSYKLRCEELNRIKSQMREPELTMVCDVLANGKARESYEQPVQDNRESLQRLWQRLDYAEDRVWCAVRNCVHLDDTTPRDEPGPLCGPTWAKVAHVLGLGSTSATALCRQIGVDPHYNCARDPEYSPRSEQDDEEGTE